MGCGSCGTKKPGGCKSNGGCSTGGCNRLNVYDWLQNLPLTFSDADCKIIEVSFKQGSRKEFFRNTSLQQFEKGEYVTVEGVAGFDVGEVSLTGELVRLQLKKKGVDEMNPDIKKVLRRSTERDLESYHYQKDREPAVQARSRELARQLNLQMKLSEVEIQADGKKATFFYTAEDRVDFRELIKLYAAEFKLKVEMRQIGIRQEAAKVGGIGSCGRELCCSTWLQDFKSVNTTAARYQNLSINQTKLSGQCGRLKCCLNYELDTYLDALQHFPENVDTLQTTKGNAVLIKKDIFKNLMWYMMEGGSKYYPLTIERVKEIKRMNAQNILPDDLEPVDVVSGKPKAIEPQFVDVVGQITLKSLEKTNKRNKGEQRRDNRDNRDNRSNEQRQPNNNDNRNRGNNNNNRSDNRQRNNNNNKNDNRNRPQQQGKPVNKPNLPKGKDNA
ncbi:PSP1 domain-containing protein [Hydrotalea sandarakina]|uniref:Cell fate regulator YaaT (PSP1 superfamily) n=1 Tax=Hydrotalea sandarakina TaxID=1004304 RepID=A0A2W7RUU6_9BACT|nr:regulatory iron-sulfur-containing complex subunit RicT [Hydrotalea sandarakina]PZX62330.1 cell fate regulator YaaT (PSP1 superfamily) [Hydrotalea sandarakina]